MYIHTYVHTHIHTYTLTGVFSGSVLMEDLFLNSELSLFCADAKSGWEWESAVYHYVLINPCVCECLYACVCMHVWLCTCVCVSACLHVRMCLCVSLWELCIERHTCLHTRKQRQSKQNRIHLLLPRNQVSFHMAVLDRQWAKSKIFTLRA